MLAQRLQQYGGAAIIDRRVAGDLVHALSDSHQSGEVKNCIDALQGAGDVVLVANVSDDQVDIGIEIFWRGAARAMNLRRQNIEGTDLVTMFEQFVGQMRTNETGPAGDQNAFAHASPSTSSRKPGVRLKAHWNCTRFRRWMLPINPTMNVVSTTTLFETNGPSRQCAKFGQSMPDFSRSELG